MSAAGRKHEHPEPREARHEAPLVGAFRAVLVVLAFVALVWLITLMAYAGWVR